MDSNDLFSFLDEAPLKAESPQADGDIPTQEPEPSNDVLPKKRKASPPTEPSNGETTPPSGEAGPSPKKPRLASPNPMVVDEVEIEAKREVAASAGLTGAVEAGSRLELRHQVCACVILTIRCLHPFRCGTKSRCRLVTLTYLSRIMYLLRNQPENTSSRWTPSSKCRYMRSSATRVSWCLHTRVQVRLL